MSPARTATRQADALRARTCHEPAVSWQSFGRRLWIVEVARHDAGSTKGQLAQFTNRQRLSRLDVADLADSSSTDEYAD